MTPTECGGTLDQSPINVRFPPIADIKDCWQSKPMDPAVQCIARDWIAYARHEDVRDAPEQVAADAQSMVELPQEHPQLAWDAIKCVAGEYSEGDLFTTEDTEAKQVLGLVAAGPLEDLLGLHGEDFIGRIEVEAQRDRRIAWMLGGMYQFLMSDEVWARTRRVAVEWPPDPE